MKRFLDQALMIMVPALALGMLRVGAASAQGPEERPVQPGTPVGCLLDPECSKGLRQHPSMRLADRDAPRSPVNPPNPVECLLDPDCSGSLRVPPGRVALFDTPVTPDDVAARGARVGEFIPFELPLRSAEQTFAHTPEPPRSRCAESFARLKQALELGDRLSTIESPAQRRGAVDALASSYENVLQNCPA